MSLAGRLAHRGKTTSAPARRARSSSSSTHAGFVRDAVELSVRRGSGRPAVVRSDLSEVDLPKAATLARALPSLAVMPQAGLNPECPAVMLDLETTGLMGQSDSIICVVGATWHVAPDRMRVEQWSLHRVGSEAAMLVDVDAVLRDKVGPRTAFVTFNGASFDLPLLRRRMVRHGIYSPTDEPLRAPHVDLLTPARRLWRDRGPDCRLGTLEMRQLQLHREDDVGGAEVVELLWRWLEDREEATAEDLAKVQRHNRIDVLSLAALAQTMHERLHQPLDDVERVRAARHHDRLRHGAVARDVLSPLLEALGRPRRAAGSELMVEAGLLAAEIERREGHRDAAAQLWAQICRSVPGHPLAHEALAKHLEHQARAPADALAVAAASVTPCERRLVRLRRKASTTPIPPVERVVATWCGPRV